jgi:hypothetical protein
MSEDARIIDCPCWTCELERVSARARRYIEYACARQTPDSEATSAARQATIAARDAAHIALTDLHYIDCPATSSGGA